MKVVQNKMFNKKYRKYVFIFPSELADHLIPTKESLAALLDVHLNTCKYRDFQTHPSPGVDIIPVPNDLFEFIVKQQYLKKGALDIVKTLSVFPAKNIQVLSIAKPDLSGVVTQYEESLKHTLEKLTLNLSELSKQVHIVSKFKELFLGTDNVSH